MLYKLVVFLHVACVFGYLIAHGVSATVAFALKKERDIQKVRTMLELSERSFPVMFLLLYAFFLLGIIAGFQGHWWRYGWIWVSIVLLLAIYVLMTILGTGIYIQARKAAGLPYRIRRKPYPAEPPKSDDEVFAILAKSNPLLLTIIGYGGFVVITWLMMAKPF
jgi:small-conductance mechanosensitive channel